MYVVTGGAGFIGSNLVEGLNRRGEDDILVVDEFSDVSQVQRSLNEIYRTQNHMCHTCKHISAPTPPREDRPRNSED